MYIFLSFILICGCFYAVYKYLDAESKQSAKENEVTEVVFNQPNSLLFFEPLPNNTVESTETIEVIEQIEPVVEPKKRGRKPKVK